MQKQPRLRSANSNLTAHIALFWLGLAATSCAVPQTTEEPEVEVGKVSAALFTNGDFEAGPVGSQNQITTPQGWTLTPYLNYGVTRQTPQTRAALNLNAGGTAQTKLLYSAAGPGSQNDAVVGSGLKWPQFGNYAALLNMNSGANYNVNSLKQSMTLGINDVDPYDGKPHIRFAVAPVVQDGGHSASDQPYYFIQVTNTTTNSILFTEYNATGDPGVPWLGSGTYYTDWMLKDIAPTSVQASLGDTIELEVLVAGCSQSGHFGRLYIDGVGPTIPGLSVKATAPSSANSNTDLTYDLVFSNDGTAAAGNVLVEFNTPPGSTYKSISAPGAVCTVPTVGATGKVSCTYGLLEIGSSNSLQVTVKIDSGATGTLTAGNYKISANNASALLGATVYTTLTTGITYTDVTVTNTNGVGAVNWGQSVVYTIKATNNGPNPVTAGTLSNPLATPLTGATWTCVGAGGGACTASGNNGINDAVNLPVGGSVTYTLSASLPSVAGSATNVRSIATFTLPGSMADSQSSDNSVADNDQITTTATLTVNKAGNATGSVVSIPGAISCGTACSSQSATFSQGSQLILAATPAAGKIFTGWSGGGCSGTSNCTVTLSANAAVTATFDSPPPCSVDTDCSSTRYCDGTTNTCAARLANGSNIPNDTIHSGTCATMGLSCASLLCNANKCAKNAGASCTAGTECASNTCTSGTCAAMPNGSSCSQNSDCNSASCKSLHCVPAGGCYADGDCLASQYCNRSNYTCTTKLTNGSALPSDGLHTGVCGDAAAVCQSGQCNTSTTTCGATNGTSCTTGNQCQNNTCTSMRCVPAVNGCYLDTTCPAGTYCDRPSLTCAPKLATGTTIPNDTYHTGACSDAAAVCASALCNPTQSTCAESNGATCAADNVCVSNKCTSGHCVPANAGCYVDADCGDGSYCNRAQLTCVSKLLAGTALPNDTLHTASCDDAPAVCVSGKCNSATSSCAADNGAACTGVAACVSNTCTSDHCVPSVNGCWDDIDCASGYCDRLTFTCAATLPPGTAIPNDGLHNGTCTPQNAQAVCTSDECNTMTNTCASISSTACTDANQCVSNTCSASMFCVPASEGCFLDSDCTGEKYCNRGTLTCAPKLDQGTAIPNDGLHLGTCADALAVCSSGTCNTAESTCAVADGNACSADTHCINDTCTSGYCVPSTNGCWLDVDCGEDYCDRTNLQCKDKLLAGDAIPNDNLHGGGCADAAAVCQSALCNSQTNTCATDNETDCAENNQCVSNQCTSDHCVPSSNGCWIDGDCADDKFCARNTLTCAAQLQAGTSVPDDGLHGGDCTDAVAVCVTDKCNTTTNTCALDDGASCSEADECVNNTCTSEHCVASSDGCYIDGDCSEGSYCDRGTFTCQTRLPNGGGIPTTDGYHAGTCSDAAALCESGKCNPTTLTCASDSNTTCTDANQCTNNVCDPNGECGINDGGSGCTPGNGTTMCQSGVCAASGRCVPNADDGCYLDSDCDAGEYCYRAGLQCKPKLDPGLAIPNDGLHDGRCTQPNAQAVCTSGGCNAVTNTCATNNGTSCTAANQCIRNICGSNSQCGYTDGAGPCTQANAKFVCQSGACSSTGNVCVPAINKSCAADSDCPSIAFCDALSAKCVPDLSNGQTVPADGLHNGLCTQPNAQAVCSSGHCNSATNQCAAAIGAACINNAECTANICGSNGKCGYAEGAGPCTSGNAATVCQSASCSQDGTCVESGHCKIDADCLPDRFCDRSVSLCHERLPAGTALPSDGYHDGTCPSSGLTPVCMSGGCSTTSNRCVLDNGETCESGEQCLSGSCGSNLKCGIEPEATGCSDGADPNCQSGVCEEGACTAGVECESDAECASDGGFCNDGNCLPRLAAGVPIPVDVLHDGSCSEQNAAAVCTSGVCNDTTMTCASEQDTECGVAAQCASNICGANGRCGLPNGAGPCTTNDAAEVCQSQTCSPNGGTCIAANGCGTDTECDADQYCDGATFNCTSKLPAGAPLPVDNLHDGTCTTQNARACQSGGCNPVENKCALANNESCMDASECTSNVCASDGRCGAQPGTGHCTPGEASQCRSGTCSASTLTCIPETNGCASPNDCATGDYCDLESHTCSERKRNGDPMPTGTSCPESGVTRDCASGLCLHDENRCVGPLGTDCSDDVQCQAGVCGENGKCGIEEGGACTQGNAAQCQSQVCSGDTCQNAAECADDGDCNASSYCNGLYCTPKLPAGSSIANDAQHDGKCTPENAAATCQSGTCNDTTNTCAGAFNTPCADAAACVSNACGADGKCGYDIGEGSCNNQNATIVCRTGLCSVVGVCLPSQTSGCAVDSDCGGTAYCDFAQNTCVAKLSDGATLPNDGLHDGTCSLQSGASLCASGACNAVSKTCARPNGASCTSATTCINNVCGDNGMCGLAEGEGACTTDLTYLCQTNRCSASQGVCIRTDNGCAADADCSSTSYCDPAARTCKPKLTAGSALPNDTLHDGNCTSTLAALVCQTGQCNAQKKTCAAVNGATCDEAAKCVSDACGNNSRCGLAVGEDGCTSLNQALTCQSSYCSASGTCVPPAGCNLDSDCSGGTYCNRTAHVCEALLRDGKVLPKDGLHNGICSAELATAVCTSGQCNSTTNTCAAAVSSGCNSAAQCVVNLCGDNSQCGLSDGAGPCSADAECQSGKCQVDSGRCVASDSGCTTDDDCAQEAHCNTTVFRCEADLDDGTDLPDDSGSDGRCTAAVAMTLCASGVCNPTTDACAAVGGSACTDNAECAGNECNDGTCGSPDGSRQCTQQNATSVCQSGICQADLYRCVAAVNGCSADSDCPYGNYCDGRTLACVGRLPPGAQLPSDEMHAAECTPEVGAAVCDSGECNTNTNACALVVGSPCSLASECASNACLDSACVPTKQAPAAFRLTGGRCSVAWVQAGSIGPSLALLWLAVVVLRRRERRKPKR